MHKFVYGAVVALWILWLTPVFLIRKRAGRVRRARTANVSWIGMLLQAAAYPFAAPLADFWRFPLPLWRVVVGLALALVALGFMWRAIPALGKQWRLVAGVNEDHVLVRSGPYAVVRHPIYASMLALLLAIAFMSAPLWRAAIGLLIFLAGTAIRIHFEDRILRERFGAEFEDYRARVPALIPFTASVFAK